jgi:Rieske Fe-S protein
MMQQVPSASRRRFIKQFVVGTAFSMLAGRDWLGTLVADCTPTTATNGILRVKISDFPALQSDNGSVRLLFNAINSISHLPANSAFYPVLINRVAAGQFLALNSRCSHQSCVVPPFDATNGSSTCPCHFSEYRIDGTVIPGSLAPLPLSRFSSFFDSVDLLCIQIPNLGYSVTGSTVQNSVGPRFRLQFTTKTRLTYEVRFRQSASDPGIVVPFSTTETGAATTNMLTVTTTSATVYVDRTTAAGFYSVAVQANEG